jgi:1-acyl-sn-glycerol-3-phosphate acyltransferase
LTDPQPRRITERLPMARGSRLAAGLLRLAGWEVVFDGLPARQGVLIGYPHTSNWDFILGIVTKWALGLQVSFWGKDSLFKIPLFGTWLRWLGGVPVDRSNSRGIVGAMVERIRQAKAHDEFFWLALSPEGTRRYLPHWRTGFYQLTLGAQVPLGLVFFDYGKKRVGVSPFFRLTGDAQADMAAIEAAYAGVVGKRHQQAGPIQFKQG